MYLAREVLDKEILDCDGFKGGKVDAIPLSSGERHTLEDEGYPLLLEVGKVVPEIPLAVLVAGKQFAANLINNTRGTQLTPVEFITDCQARSGTEEIFQQTYMCNPVPGAAGIVDWSAIERCRSDRMLAGV